MTTIQLGVHEQYHGKNAVVPTTTYDRFPKQAVAREFTPNELAPQNLVPKFRSACKASLDASMVCVWSFKPRAEDVLTGAFTPYLQQLASEIGNKEVIVVPWHEPENNFRENPKLFVDMFNTTRNIMRSQNPNVLFAHAALGYAYRDRGEVKNPLDWRTEADINTIDIYSGRSFKLATILPELTGFRNWYNKLVTTTSKPWGVTERGWMADTSTEFATRATTIQREAKWIVEQDVKPSIYIVWNTEGTESDDTLKLDSLGITAVNNAFDIMSRSDTPPPVDTVECPLCHGTGKIPAGQTVTVTTIHGG